LGGARNTGFPQHPWRNGKKDKHCGNGTENARFSGEKRGKPRTKETGASERSGKGKNEKRKVLVINLLED